MSSFKKLKSSDVSLIPYTANKQWDLNFCSYPSDDSYITIYKGTNLTSSFNPDTEPVTENQYERLVYDSINHLFYQSYSGSLLNTSSLANSLFYESASENRPIKSYFNYNEDSMLVKNFPSGSNNGIRVLAVNQNIFGSQVLPYNFQLSSSAYLIMDDGRGNLYEESTHVGNIFYSHGLAIITNQDYQDMFPLPPLAFNDYYTFIVSDVSKNFTPLSNDIVRSGTLVTSSIVLSGSQSSYFAVNSLGTGSITTNVAGIYDVYYTVEADLNNECNNLVSNKARIRVNIVEDEIIPTTTSTTTTTTTPEPTTTTSTTTTTTTPEPTTTTSTTTTTTTLYWNPTIKFDANDIWVDNNTSTADNSTVFVLYNDTSGIYGSITEGVDTTINPGKIIEIYFREFVDDFNPLSSVVRFDNDNYSIRVTDITLDITSPGNTNSPDGINLYPATLKYYKNNILTTTYTLVDMGSGRYIINAFSSLDLGTNIQPNDEYKFEIILDRTTTTTTTTTTTSTTTTTTTESPIILTYVNYIGGLSGTSEFNFSLSEVIPSTAVTIDTVAMQGWTGACSGTPDVTDTTTVIISAGNLTGVGFGTGFNCSGILNYQRVDSITVNGVGLLHHGDTTIIGGRTVQIYINTICEGLICNI